MSVSKRMQAAGRRDDPHPLAGWRSAAEWAASTTRPAGRWVNPIGIDLATLADPGFEPRESECPGHIQVGANRYSMGRWVADTPEPETPREPEPIAPSRAGRRRHEEARQLSLFD